MSAPVKGNRKHRHSSQVQFFLLLGFVVAVYLKASDTMFTAYVSALVTASGAFMWGNVQEHKAAATPLPPTP